LPPQTARCANRYYISSPGISLILCDAMVVCGTVRTLFISFFISILVCYPSFPFLLLDAAVS
jgi:hypothetical protein